ncbi:hypothetical protein OQJ18_04400 [Fluoribacter dumoffii]|uniref:Uncharacterized protein n=1 Tax=Fluoribacter dumoffii TaxID=463 RepID=A0A377G9G6_9GAMM|nr:hypothetical protein [Fluoribacter dumoffii]KTC90327.1 hypothetical protein Ldum_1395 [Fluoribacter dumoffii NY 23]MCW8385644.1 hypothetical protein [Fluoribacter dumoffii]MCW8418673.1 hypothetical protein [Fluoribacter dumoffii]MCW8453483.1 hypothetical protein [Fluoribacter dumoffii]MCW8459297.1 hypothetical protein [Fluoribacter dumoffii]
MKMSPFDIKIETLLLVTVWKQPSIFQGCFKISSLYFQHENYFLFRCEVDNSGEIEFIETDFFPENYHFTHIYNQEQQLNLDQQSESWEHAVYVLKYSLYRTIKEMLTNNSQKHQSLSMDEVFVDSLLAKIKPLLAKEPLWNESMSEIGFAVSMDFCPEENMGESAAYTLMSAFETHELIQREIH